MLPVGADDLERGDLLGRKAVLAGQPADAAAERVADDADVVRGARQRGQAVLGSRADDLAPRHTGTDPHGLRGRLDPDVPQPFGPDHQRPADAAVVGGGVVAGALDADLEAVVAGEANRPGDVGRVGRDRDGGRVLVDCQVPGEASLVPAGVSRRMKIAFEGTSKGDHVDGAGVCFGDRVHRGPPRRLDRNR